MKMNDSQGLEVPGQFCSGLDTLKGQCGEMKMRSPWHNLTFAGRSREDVVVTSDLDFGLVRADGGL